MQPFDRNKQQPTDKNLTVSINVATTNVTDSKTNPDAFNERRAMLEKQCEHAERWDGMS